MAQVTFFDHTFEVAEELPKLESHSTIVLNLGNPAVVAAMQRSAYTTIKEVYTLQDFLAKRKRLL